MRTVLKNRMKRRVESFLTSSCTIQRKSNTKDARGAPAGEFLTVIQNVKCRLIKASKNQTAQIGNQEKIIESYRLILPADTPIGASYSVVISGMRYQVESVETALTDELYTEVTITRDR